MFPFKTTEYKEYDTCFTQSIVVGVLITTQSASIILHSQYTLIKFIIYI